MRAVCTRCDAGDQRGGKGRGIDLLCCGASRDASHRSRDVTVWRRDPARHASVTEASRRRHSWSWSAEVEYDAGLVFLSSIERGGCALERRLD